jgi:N12 class adenine-specific DNA methylase
VWRILSEPTVLLAHGVGAGKTATMVMAGREMKRLGTVSKPAYVVPNHMLEQFSREYLQLYPQAKILVAGRDDVSPARRKEFVARCAAEDWDAVIMTHAGFERVPVSAATEREFLESRIADLRASIDASTSGGKGLTVKNLEKLVARVEERHKALVADPRRDEGGLCFEATGIDYVYLDEAQAYKNLAVTSRITGVRTDGSKRAEDMAMKLDWLRSNRGHRVATFATATPIANSIAEMYVMQRYLAPDALTVAGVEHFDGWAANFGRTVTTLELAPDSASYRMTTRFARFANVPDLLRMFRAFADVRTGDQLRLAVPDLTGGRPETLVVPACDELKAYVAELAERAEAIRNRAVRPEEDNMLKVSGDGRKAALHLRLVGRPADPDGGKLAAAASVIARIHHESRDRPYLGDDRARSSRRGALQLVFCDLVLHQATFARNEMARSSGCSRLRLRQAM